MDVQELTQRLKYNLSFSSCKELLNECFHNDVKALEAAGYGRRHCSRHCVLHEILNSPGLAAPLTCRYRQHVPAEVAEIKIHAFGRIYASMKAVGIGLDPDPLVRYQRYESIERAKAFLALLLQNDLQHGHSSDCEHRIIRQNRLLKVSDLHGKFPQLSYEVDDSNATVLHIAAKYCAPEIIVYLLLQRFDNANQRDACERFPIHVAMEHKNWEAATVLLCSTLMDDTLHDSIQSTASRYHAPDIFLDLMAIVHNGKKDDDIFEECIPCN